jgi:hypothetical protein
MTVEPRQIFALRIAAPPGAAGLHALRALLKRLLRQHGFRALDVREESDAAAIDPDNRRIARPRPRFHPFPRRRKSPQPTNEVSHG